MHTARTGRMASYWLMADELVGVLASAVTETAPMMLAPR